MPLGGVEGCKWSGVGDEPSGSPPSGWRDIRSRGEGQTEVVRAQGGVRRLSERRSQICHRRGGIQEGIQLAGGKWRPGRRRAAWWEGFMGEFLRNIESSSLAEEAHRSSVKNPSC